MILAIAVVTIENIANQQHDFFIKESEKYKLHYEQVADKVSQRNNLVAINCGENPQDIYLLHRKGWIITSEQAMDKFFLRNLQDHHCKYLFINKHVPLEGAVDPQLMCVYNDEHIAVYRLPE